MDTFSAGSVDRDDDLRSLQRVGIKVRPCYEMGSEVVADNAFGKFLFGIETNLSDQTEVEAIIAEVLRDTLVDNLANESCGGGGDDRRQLFSVRRIAAANARRLDVLSIIGRYQELAGYCSIQNIVDSRSCSVYEIAVDIFFNEEEDVYDVNIDSYLSDAVETFHNNVRNGYYVEEINSRLRASNLGDIVVTNVQFAGRSGEDPIFDIYTQPELVPQLPTEPIPVVLPPETETTTAIVTETETTVTTETETLTDTETVIVPVTVTEPETVTVPETVIVPVPETETVIVPETETVIVPETETVTATVTETETGASTNTETETNVEFLEIQAEPEPEVELLPIGDPQVGDGTDGRSEVVIAQINSAETQAQQQPERQELSLSGKIMVPIAGLFLLAIACLLYFCSRHHCRRGSRRSSRNDKDYDHGSTSTEGNGDLELDVEKDITTDSHGNVVVAAPNAATDDDEDDNGNNDGGGNNNNRSIFRNSSARNSSARNSSARNSFRNSARNNSSNHLDGSGSENMDQDGSNRDVSEILSENSKRYYSKKKFQTETVPEDLVNGGDGVLTGSDGMTGGSGGDNDVMTGVMTGDDVFDDVDDNLDDDEQKVRNTDDDDNNQAPPFRIESIYEKELDAAIQREIDTQQSDRNISISQHNQESQKSLDKDHVSSIPEMYPRVLSTFDESYAKERSSPTNANDNKEGNAKADGGYNFVRVDTNNNDQNTTCAWCNSCNQFLTCQHC